MGVQSPSRGAQPTFTQAVSLPIPVAQQGWEKPSPAPEVSPGDVLEPGWQSTACAWALARRGWQSQPTPQSLLEPRVGISQPIPLPVLSTGGWGTDCHTGWELVAVRALPTAGKDSEAEDGIFYCKEAWQGEGALPWGEESPFLLPLVQAKLSLPEQKHNHCSAFPKECVIRGRRAAPTSEPQTQTHVADLVTVQRDLLMQRDFGAFLLPTQSASSIQTVLRCFDAFSTFAKQYLQLVHQNSSESPATHKSSGNLCFHSV